MGGGSTTGGAGGAGLYALPLQGLCAGAWAMRPLQDCKHARLPRTKTTHFFDLLEKDGTTMLAIAVGRRIMLLKEEEKTDTEMGFEFTHIRVRS